MKHKAIEWTIFGIAAASMVILMRWFLPRAIYQAKAKFNPALRRRLREEETRLAQNASSGTHGPSGSSSCLVLPVKAGISDAAGRGATKPPGSAPSQPASPIRDCLDLVPGGAPANAVEFNLNNATVLFVQTDLYLPGDPPIAFTRVVQRYVRWNSKYQVYLPDGYLTFPTGHRNPYTDMTVWLADKRRVLFKRISKGTGYADAVYETGSTGSVFDDALIGWVGNQWDCDLADGRTLVFPEAYSAKRPQQSSMVGLIEPSGASFTFKRDREGNLQEVRSSDGRWMKLRYQGPLVVSITDSAGESAAYSYDDRDRLSSSTNTAGQTLTYSYNASDGLEKVEDGKTLQRVLSVQYDSGEFPRSIQVDGGPSFRVAPGLDFRDDRGHDWFARCAKITDSGCRYEVSIR